jgi:hypothetical protein
MKIRVEINETLRNVRKEKQLLLLLKFITIFIFHESYCLFTPFVFVSAVCNPASVTQGSS